MRPRATRPQLTKLLRLFAEIRPGEGLLLSMMLLNVFVILVGYYMLKPVREELLQGGFVGLPPNHAKVVLTGLSAALLLIVIPTYSALVTRFTRLRLLNVSMLFVLISLLAFFVTARARVRIGPAFFLWLSVINVFLVAQFWSYANDLYTQEAGKRLFASIAIGMGTGGIVGSYASKSYHGDKLSLLLMAAVIFSLVLLLYNLIEAYIQRTQAANALEDDPEEDPSSAAMVASNTPPADSRGAFSLVFRSRYLRLIALMMVLANVVNTSGEFILFSAATEVATVAYPDSAFPEITDHEVRGATLEDARGRVVREFYGNFFFWVNLVSLLIQALLVSRIFKYLGIRAALFALPLIALGGYALIGLLGAVSVVWASKLAENSTDYSLQNTIKQALYLPTTPAEKYKAKAAIDTFFVRGGDLLAALVTIGLGLALGVDRRGFALVNVGFAAIWVVIAYAIAREHRRIADE